ncbi:MAG: tRNA-dihydrouridine synthase [Deltaproteobacteria bacterium]|nr:tRNA-dihydrouridine synthase [Deltaproteobacteria bacterium]
MVQQTFLGFWETLQKPIIGLSPMDGVTDSACRYILAKHAKPDVMFTEFATVEGLFRAPEKILKDFEYHEIERPIVAQIYGHTPENFYRVAQVVCELGFDGVDINMGCPAKSVVQCNAGGKLITSPNLALEIIQAVRQGIEDWVQQGRLEENQFPRTLLEILRKMNKKRCGVESPAIKQRIPYSVKTRIGYDSVVIEKWVGTLLKESPAAISIHGRTLKQMYRGKADWDAIARGAKIIKETETLVFGNGDISSAEQAEKLVENNGLDGALIGRSAIGNPWIFSKTKNMETRIDRQCRIETALEHAHYFGEMRGTDHFNSLNKHLMAYLKNFPDAAKIRVQVLGAKNFEDLICRLQDQL